MNGIRVIVESDFENEVLKSETPVLVDFFAPWCGPCRMLAPALEGIAETYEGRVKVVKVNVDDSPSLAYTYRVEAVPTLVVFSEGKPVDKMVGFPPLAALKQKLDEVAAQPVESESCGCCCSR